DLALEVAPDGLNFGKLRHPLRLSQPPTIRRPPGRPPARRLSWIAPPLCRGAGQQRTPWPGTSGHDRGRNPPPRSGEPPCRVVPTPPAGDSCGRTRRARPPRRRGWTPWTAPPTGPHPDRGGDARRFPGRGPLRPVPGY